MATLVGKSSPRSLTCTICGDKFTRKGTRGPVPQFCSVRCKSKRDRARPGRKEYERLYRRASRASGKRKAYEREYNRRPEVKERNRKRMMWKWHNDPEWRHAQLLRMRSTIHPEIVVPAPYTGHRWLDMAAKVVMKGRSLDHSAPWADDYHDDMGEAVLALLEGRDMAQAVRDYRNKEFVPRKLTIHMGDWIEDEDYAQRWFDRVMPTTPSAEDEYMATEPITVYAETRFRNVHTRNRRMKNKQSTPSNRRSNRR